MDAVRRSGNPFIRPTPDQSKADLYCFNSFMYNNRPQPQNYAPTIPAMPANILGDQVTVGILPRNPAALSSPPPTSHVPPQSLPLQNTALPISTSLNSSTSPPVHPPRRRSSNSSWLCGLSSSSGPSPRGASRDIRPRPAAAPIFDIAPRSTTTQPSVPPGKGPCPSPISEYTATKGGHLPPCSYRPHHSASSASHGLHPSLPSYRGASPAPPQNNAIPLRSRARASRFSAHP